jgi:hypothetical protein
VSGPEPAGGAIRGWVPWGSSSRNGPPVGKPYVWRGGGRQHQAVPPPPEAREPVAAGDGPESAKSCEQCGYLVTAGGHRVSYESQDGRRAGVSAGDGPPDGKDPGRGTCRGRVPDDVAVTVVQADVPGAENGGDSS